MLAIRKHDVKDYARLPNIDAPSVGKLDKVDLACLDEIGDHLVAARQHERFGMILLHSHFPIDDEETLTEEVSPSMNVLTLRPKRDPAPGLTATSVYFEDIDDGDAVQLIGIEYAQRQVLNGVEPFDQGDGKILAQVGTILNRHGKARRFGVRLLHDPLKLDGRVLLETSDVANRVLTCQAASANDIAFKEAIPTIFCWKPVGERVDNDLVVSQSCVQFCKSVRGCVSVGGSHQGSSSHDPIHGEGPQ